MNLQQHQLVNKLGWVRDLAFDITVDGLGKVQFELGDFRLDKIAIQLIPFSPDESVATIQKFLKELKPITFEDVPAFDVYIAPAAKLINEIIATLPKHHCLSSPLVWNNGALLVSIKPYPRFTYSVIPQLK